MHDRYAALRSYGVGNAFNRRTENPVGLRPHAHQMQARFAKADRLDVRRHQHGDLQSTEATAGRHDQRAPRGVGACGQHALAGADRAHCVCRACAEGHRIERCDRVGSPGKRLSRFDPLRRGKRHRSIRPRIGGEIGSHGPAVAQGERGPRERGLDDDVLGENPSQRRLRFAAACRDRRHARLDQGEHVSEGGQPVDALQVRRVVCGHYDIIISLYPSLTGIPQSRPAR